MNRLMLAFRPSPTVSLAATTTTANVRVNADKPSGQDRHVRVYNSGDSTVFLAFGGSTVIASTTTGYPMPPGVMEIVSLPDGATHVAGITAGGSDTVYLTPGEGF